MVPSLGGWVECERQRDEDLSAPRAVPVRLSFGGAEGCGGEHVARLSWLYEGIPAEFAAASDRS